MKSKQVLLEVSLVKDGLLPKRMVTENQTASMWNKHTCMVLVSEKQLSKDGPKGFKTQRTGLCIKKPASQVV